MPPRRRPLHLHFAALVVLSGLLLFGAARLVHATRIAHFDLDIDAVALLAAFSIYSLLSLRMAPRLMAAGDDESAPRTGARWAILLHTVVALGVTAGAGAFLSVIVIASTASGHANFVKLLLRPVTVHCFVIAGCFAAVLWIRAMNALRERGVVAWWHRPAEAGGMTPPTHNLDGSPWRADEEEFFSQVLGKNGA